jgi:ribonuclease J
MRVTLYGGVNEVGGNKILIRERDTKIFLDFGMSFAQKKTYYEEYLNPRVANGLGDLLEMGLVPNLKGLYRRDLLEMMGEEWKAPEYQAVILSHAHLDHWSYASVVDERIPIYCGETTELYLKAIQESSNRIFEQEILDFLLRPNFNDEHVERKLKTFRTFQKENIGGMEVNPIHVDHSIAGAYGFIIRTSNGSLAYSGDIRRGGLNKEMSEDFICKASEEKIDALILDGTRVKEEKDWESNGSRSSGRTKLLSEDEVKESSEKIIRAAPSIVFVDFNFKDIDRVQTFYAIAKETGRKFVISCKDASLLYWLNKDEKLKGKIPSLEDEEVLVYKRKKNTGTYLSKDYLKWEKCYLGDIEADGLRVHKDPLTAEEIREKQSEIIMTLNYYRMGELIDIKPKEGIYIHSKAFPVDEEQEIDFKKLENWIEHFGLKQHHCHTSGHLTREQTKDLIAQVRPKYVIPIHTEYPSEFKGIAGSSELILPKIGEEIKIS